MSTYKDVLHYTVFFVYYRQRITKTKFLFIYMHSSVLFKNVFAPIYIYFLTQGETEQVYHLRKSYIKCL